MMIAGQSFAIDIIAAAALFLFSCQSAIAASNTIEAPKDPVDAFALAFNVNRANVKEVSQIPLGDDSTVSLILLGIYKDVKTYQAGLITIYTRQDKNYIGEVIRLIPGDSIRFVDILDLRGVPKTIHLQREMPAGNIDEKTISDLKSPALLLNITKESNPKEDTLFLTTIRRSPLIIWQETVSSIYKEGGGYRTIRMQLEQGEGEYLEIRLIQTTRPHKGEKPYMPGPPLTRKFIIKDGTYQRIVK